MTRSFDEAVILAYFKEIDDEYAPSTLWPRYSTLKRMVKLENDVDISNYTKVHKYLKTKTKNYKPKKAKAFESDELKRYLEEASDDEHLDVKVLCSSYHTYYNFTLYFT